jgi:hypothetical protein
VRDGAGEENRVVRLNNAILIDKLKLGDYRADLVLALIVQVRNVAYDEVIAIKGDSVAFLDETPKIVIMTD